MSDAAPSGEPNPPVSTNGSRSQAASASEGHTATSTAAIGEAGAEHLKLGVIWMYVLPRLGIGVMGILFGNNKVYSDQSGGEEQTIVDWIFDMIAFEPGSSDPGEWQNVECTDCEIVLPGDPTPQVIPTAPFFSDMGEIVIICPE